MTRRIGHYFAALLSGQAIAALTAVLLVPAFLARWTPALYGEWLALSSLAAYLSTLDFGMNSAVNNRLIAAHARGDRDEYAGLQHTALAFYLALAAAGTLLLVPLTCLLSARSALGLRLIAPADASAIVLLLGGLVLWKMPAGLLANLYRTIGEPARTKWIDNTERLLLFSMTVWLLRRGVAPMALAGWQVVPSVVVTAGCWLDIRRRHRHYGPGLSRVSRGILRELIPPSLLFGIVTLAWAITLQGPVLVLAHTSGGAAVAVFAATRTLTALLRQLASQVGFAAWPEITRLHADGERDALAALVRLVCAVAGTVAIALGGALWFEGESLMRAWTRGALVPSPLFLRMMVGATALQTVWLSAGVVAMATNQHGALARAQLRGSIVSLAIGAAGVRWLGLAAIPLGVLLGEGALCCRPVVDDACRRIAADARAFHRWLWRGLARQAAVVMLAAGGAHELVKGPAPFRWLAVGAASALSAAWVLRYGWLSPDERQPDRRGQRLFARAEPRG